MKFSYLFASMALCIILITSSCSKDEQSLLEQRIDMLTARTWIVTVAMADSDGDGTPETDVFAFYDECDKDDEMDFSEEGTFVNSEGLSKCDPNDDDIVERGQWEFQQAGDILKVVNEDAEITNYEIVTMSRTTMTVHYSKFGSSFTTTFKSK